MKLSELIGMKVCSEKNEKLGYIYDVISSGRPVEGKPAAAAEVQGIIYGSKNFLERFEISSPKRFTVDWKDVIEIKTDCVVVRKK